MRLAPEAAPGGTAGRILTIPTPAHDGPEAILDAVHKRARPIVMTTIAMAAGMLPSAISTAEGSEFRAPMAIAVIGGLLLSTLLSLLFVPSLFSLLHGGQKRVGGWLQRRLGLNSASPSAAE